MSNSDQDARNDAPRESDLLPATPVARTSPFQAPDASPSTDVAANDTAPPKPRPTRRRKQAEPVAADAASLFDTPEAPAADAQDAAPAPPRAAPRRRTARTAAPAAGTQESPPSQPEPADSSPPQVTVSEEVETPAVAVAVPDQPATDASAEAAPSAPAGSPVAEAAPDVAEPSTAEPAMKSAMPGPPRPLVITASDAALAIVNPHPIRATDRPDGYLYHLTSPGEAKVLLQSGLPCSFEDPIILTERGGIPYWMAVLSEDFDDILDGPAAVTVLRVRRRAVQNAIEADADSSRAAQVPCYLLSGVSDLPPAPPAPPPPLLRARPPAPAGDAADPGTGVEMGGTVKWYNPRKGFGFITPGSGGKDVFVHASTLERAGLTQLTDGQSVRMQVIQGAKGPEAASLTLA